MCGCSDAYRTPFPGLRRPHKAVERGQNLEDGPGDEDKFHVTKKLIFIDVYHVPDSKQALNTH
jgi:hypothetical protein